MDSETFSQASTLSAGLSRLLSFLPVRTFGNDTDHEGRWILCDDFIKHLKLNHSAHDALKEVRKLNVIRELRKYSTGLAEIDGRSYMSTLAVLKYMFSHTDNLQFCKLTCQEIESIVFGVGDEYPISIFDIYKKIAKFPLKEKWIEQQLAESIIFPIIDTLQYEYQPNFTAQEWARISLFELNFSDQVTLCSDMRYEEEVAQRWEFLQRCREMQNIGQDLARLGKELIRKQNHRKCLAEIQNGVTLRSGTGVHVPSCLDLELQEQLHNIVGDVFCVSVDALPEDRIQGISVFIEGTNVQNLDEMLPLILNTVTIVHNSTLLQVILLSEGTIAAYRNASTGESRRFNLRDDFLRGRLNSVVHHEKVMAKADDENANSEHYCQQCFNRDSETPLDWRTFDANIEWHLKIPLQFQVLFENFISKGSAYKTQSVDTLFQRKVVRLYSTVDILLNTLNRTYSGILQALNTQELLMNYHSIQTVFSVASASGATLSIKSAERQLREKADLDACYYKTYLQKHLLPYNSIGGSKEALVSLRECILIFYIDNLVRLTFRTDPNRGESRSKQVCTLPITVKGLPKDTQLIQDWHNPRICDGSATCPCKEPVTLTKDDKDLVLGVGEEGHVSEKFSELMNWSHTTVFKILMKSDVRELIQKAVCSPAAAEHFKPHETVVQGTSCAITELTRNDTDTILQNNKDDDNEESLCLEEMMKAIQIADFPGDEDCCCPLPENETGDESSLFRCDVSAVVDDETTGLPECEDSLSTTTSSMETDSGYSFGFQYFRTPSLLCKHPAPAVGRDDDQRKLQEILDDFLMKSGNYDNCDTRILFAPDHKIAKNLFQLQAISQRYKNFLPEVPLLHLRKSKIVNLTSAYKDAGLLHLMKYMRDDEAHDDWTQLLSVSNIETATRYIKRLAVAFQQAFLVAFLQSLPETEAECLLNDLLQNDPQQNCQTWNNRFSAYMKMGSSRNATFALHHDMMVHCREVVAIAFSERLGGPDGYKLLLSTMKSSLPFAFLNGAASYAGFCLQLLVEYYSCGPFHQRLKEHLYTTRHGESQRNFGLDTQREMDHLFAKKGFRPGATANSVLPRLSLVDEFQEAHKKRAACISGTNDSTMEMVPACGLNLDDTDLAHIVPVVSVILRRGAISLHEEARPRNVYQQNTPTLSENVFDKNTFQLEKFLIEKYACDHQFFGLSKSDCPSPDNLAGPKDLVQRIKRTKGATVKRFTKTQAVVQSAEEAKEVNRKKQVAKQSKLIDTFSSEMNLCQAVVKPDCSKPKVTKSQGVQKAIISMMSTIKPVDTSADAGVEESLSLSSMETMTAATQDQGENDMFLLSTKSFPSTKAETIKAITVEFAGVKFKTKALNGRDYLKSVENGTVRRLLKIFPSVQRMIICEEKYSFTPDDFKAATRVQRQHKSQTSIAHLKTNNEMLDMETLCKAVVVGTSEGKTLISTFLAQHVQELGLKYTVLLDIDSEFVTSGCKCLGTSSEKCTCKLYTSPLRAVFSAAVGFVNKITLPIEQRKGEAEMAQVDWLFDCIDGLKEGDAVASFVTPGDIDAVCIHLFTLAHMWPRRFDGTFLHPAYVILQKPSGVMDVYNITHMLETMEAHFTDRLIGMKVALVLCIGGNDFLPKFQGHTHAKLLELFLSQPHFISNLFTLNNRDGCGLTNVPVFKDLMKHIYCPASCDPSKLSLEAIRNLSIKLPGKDFRPPPTWMPPESALEHLAQLIDLQIAYLYTAGHHDAETPDFLSKDCLVKNTAGHINYYLGTNTHVIKKEDAVTITETELREKLKTAKKDKPRKKRSQIETPQKGDRRKRRPLTSTPRKN